LKRRELLSLRGSVAARGARAEQAAMPVVAASTGCLIGGPHTAIVN
jgi:hypothetical protein